MQNVSGGRWFLSGSSGGYRPHGAFGPRTESSNVNIGYEPSNGNGVGFTAGREWNNYGSANHGSMSIHHNGFNGRVFSSFSGGRVVDTGVRFGFTHQW